MSRGPAPLSPGSVATSPVEAAAIAAPRDGSKPKRIRSAKRPPPPPAFPAAVPSPAAPIYGGDDGAGGDSDAAVPWADEVEKAAPPAPVVPPLPPKTKATTPKGPFSTAAALPFIPAQQPQQRAAAAADDDKEEGEGRRASRAEASPGPSSMAAAAAAAGGGGGGSKKGESRKASRGGGKARSVSRASEERQGGAHHEGSGLEGGRNDNDADGNDSNYPLPKLHPTRSATREPVIRISDAVDPSVPDVPLERNQAIALIEKVAKRDREGVFRVREEFFLFLEVLREKDEEECRKKKQKTHFFSLPSFSFLKKKKKQEVPSDFEAPGYSRLIARPIAFSTIRSRAASNPSRGGGYANWDDLCEDLDLMLDNCRAFNGPDSPWGLYADSFQMAAARMLQLSRAGEEFFFFFFWGGGRFLFGFLEKELGGRKKKLTNVS